ncbi:MAG: hypothetical protein AB7E74_05230 [Pirellulales bacterium]
MVLRSPGYRQLVLAAAIGWVVQTAVAQEPPVSAGTPAASESSKVTPTGDAGDSRPDDTEASPAAAVLTAPAIAERAPSIFLVPDAAGGLQPVLNLSLERLERLLAGDDSGSMAARPDFALSITAQGEAQATDATLEVNFEIKALKGGWIAVPLRLDEGLLVPGSDRYDGPGSAVIVPASGERGYLCWLRGDGEATHQLRLTLRVPLELRSTESRLSLTLPRAIGAQLSLRVAGDRVQGRTREPAMLDVETAIEGGGTFFRLQTVGERFELSWSSAEGSGAAAVESLASTGAVSIYIEGNVIRSKARLSVQALVGEFSSCHVRLPPGAQLVHSTAARGFSVHELSPTDAEAPPPAEEPGAGRIVAVRLKQPAEQVELQLETERSLGNQTQPEDQELAGFEVVEARRQSGYYALSVDGDRQVVWQRQHQLRQVTPAELPAPLNDETWLAAFEFTTQPSSLVCRLVPRTPRVTGSVSCAYLVESNSIRLQARLKYSVRGARMFALECQGLDENWQIEEIGPATLVDLDKLVLEQRQPLVVPLLKPVLGEIEITIVARRAWPGDETTWRQVLPEPVASVSRPGSLVVAPTANIQIVPQATELAGLVPQPWEATDELLPGASEEALSYRTTGPRPQFVAQFRRLPRETAAQVTTLVECRRHDLVVAQTTVVQISREPADHLIFEAPASWSAVGGREVLIDGRPANLVRSDELDSATDDTATQPAGDADMKGKTTNHEFWRLTLPQPRLGRVEVVTRYTLPLDLREPTSADQVAVPLAMPTVDRLTHNELRLASEPGLEARLESALWHTASSVPVGRGDLGVGQRLTAEGPAFEAPLRVAAAASAESPDLVVDRVWIQTWHLGDDRVDRAVFSFSTRESRVEFELPPGADLRTLHVLVGGARVSPTRGTASRVFVPLSGEITRRQVIELRYLCADSLPRWGSLKLVPPLLVPGAWVRQIYWQFACRDQEHLVMLPENWGPEFAWHWSGLGWVRKSRLDDAALERWSGAIPERDPPQGYHRYLASRLGELQSATIVTAPKWLLVLVASGVTLIGGLLLLYVPLLRRPECLLFVGVLLIAVTLLDSQLAALVAQAGILGVLLSLLAAWWQRQVRGRRPTRVIVTRSNSSRLEHDLTPTALAVAPLGSNSSTTAASVPVE